MAAALQRWERYSAHAVAAREVAAALARPASRLYVLSMYDHELLRLPSGGISAAMAARLREQEVERTDRLMQEKIDEYVAPLVAAGLPVTTLLRVGSVRHTIVEVASEVEADLLIIIGSHSKRGLFDIALGHTARHVSTHAPCTVLMVSPRK